MSFDPLKDIPELHTPADFAAVSVKLAEATGVEEHVTAAYLRSLTFEQLVALLAFVNGLHMMWSGLEHAIQSLILVKAGEEGKLFIVPIDLSGPRGNPGMN